MDDPQLCRRVGFSCRESDWRSDRMERSRHTCDGDHRLVLPCLLGPFGGPCAAMAAIAAHTLKGSEAVTALLSGCPTLHWIIRHRCLQVRRGVPRSHRRSRRIVGNLEAIYQHSSKISNRKSGVVTDGSDRSHGLSPSTCGHPRCCITALPETWIQVFALTGACTTRRLCGQVARLHFGERIGGDKRPTLQNWLLAENPGLARSSEYSLSFSWVSYFLARLAQPAIRQSIGPPEAILGQKATRLAEIVTRVSQNLGTANDLSQPRARLPATSTIFYSPLEWAPIGGLRRFGVHRESLMETQSLPGSIITKRHNIALRGGIWFSSRNVAVFFVLV